MCRAHNSDTSRRWRLCSPPCTCSRPARCLLHTHTHTHTHTHAHTCTHMHTHAHTCTHTCAHMHTHAHTHGRKHSLSTHTPQPQASTSWGHRAQISLSLTALLFLSATPLSAPSPALGTGYICACVNGLVHARTHARTHVRTHARTHARTNARTHARTQRTHTHLIEGGDGALSQAEIAK